MNRRRFLQLSAAAVPLVCHGRSGPAVQAQERPVAPAKAAAPAPAYDLAAARRTLAEHRIARIETLPFQDRFPRAVGPNSRGGGGTAGGAAQVRRITTDKGVAGWSTSGGKLDDEAALIGRPVGSLIDPADGAAADVPWPLDRVLHDLAGVLLGLPVWRMLGAAGPRATLVYDGAIYFDDLVPQDKPRGIEGLLGFCRQDYDAGYRAFKLKLGRGAKLMPRPEGLRRDIEVVRAVRRRFPDCRILVDANDGWTVEDACEFVKAVADCNLYWIEEPFDEHRDGLARLKDAMAAAGCKASIADGEARKDRAETPTAYGGYTQAFVDRLYALAAEKLVDIFVLDLDTVGYSRWRRVMPDLVKAGVRASPHLWMWTQRTYYAAHLAAGVGNIPILEGIPGRCPGMDYSAFAFTDGLLTPPDSPGFGLRLA